MHETSQASLEKRLNARDVGGDLVLLTWAEAGPERAPGVAAEEAYAAIAEVLGERGAVPLQERIFGDLQAAQALIRGRSRVVGRAPEWAVPPTCVEGAPVGRRGLAGVHVIGARGSSRALGEGARACGRLVEGRSARLLGLADVGRRAAPHEAPAPARSAAAAIDAAAELLAREGFSFRDVFRTWYYLRDILDWYGPFNAVRNDAFSRMGLIGPGGDGNVPASTGIEGRGARGGWCTLDLLAAQARDGGRLERRRLYSREQNEPAEYGSAFARAVELVLGDARYIFVSGTAAVDHHGNTVHPGDFEAQARHTLGAVEALLAGAGARLADIAQATAFLKSSGDGHSFERIIGSRGLEAMPLVTTVADVCRADLLFELDATAVVPRRREVS